MSIYTLDAFTERVNYAARCIQAGNTNSRNFDTCFEMWDGDYVVAMLMRRANRARGSFNRSVITGWLRRPDLIADWEKTAAQFDNLSDNELRQAAKLYREECVAKMNARYGQS